MIKVVIDTNVVVSAHLVDKGPSAAIFQLATNKKAVLMCVSPDILAEYEEVLKRPRFKLPLEQVEGALSLIRSTAELVHPATTLKISGHDSDNRFYECAETARAEYLITGNSDDFPEDHLSTKIITPRNFLDAVVPHLSLGEH